MEFSITIADYRDPETQTLVHTNEGIEFVSEIESVIVFANEETETPKTD